MAKGQKAWNGHPLYQPKLNIYNTNLTSTKKKKKKIKIVFQTVIDDRKIHIIIMNIKIKENYEQKL